MQRQHRLLLFALDGDRLDAGALDRRPAGELRTCSPPRPAGRRGVAGPPSAARGQGHPVSRVGRGGSASRWATYTNGTPISVCNCMTGATTPGTELHPGRSQRVGGLQCMPAVHAPLTLRAVPDFSRWTE